MRGVVIIVGVLGLLTACDPAPPQDDGSILIVAMAGPTCPVETDPPDPDCAPQPVARAPVFVMPANGQDIVIAQGETGADGRLTLAVPVGDYIVTAGAVEGLISAPEPVVLSVLAGLTTEVPLGYDTGIRWSPNALIADRALRSWMILADNGSLWFFSGSSDIRWDDDQLNDLKSLRGSDFEVVNTSGFVNGP